MTTMIIQDEKGIPLPSTMQPGGPIFQAISDATDKMGEGTDGTASFEGFMTTILRELAPVVNTSDFSKLVIASPRPQVIELREELVEVLSHALDGFVTPMINQVAASVNGWVAVHGDQR